MKEKYLRALVITGITLGILTSIHLTYYYVGPALIRTFSFLLRILVPVVLAVALAAMLEPVVSFLQRQVKLSRGWAALISIVLLVLVLGGLSFIAVSKLVDELGILLYSLPNYAALLNQNLDRLLEWFNGISIAVNFPKTIQESILANLDKLTSLAGNYLSQAMNYLVASVSWIPNFLAASIFLLLATFFFIRDKQLIFTWAGKLFNEKQSRKLEEVYEHLASILFGYLKAFAILVIITTLLIILGLSILGIKYAVLGGILAGIADILPIVGPGLVLVPWGTWYLLTGDMRLGISILVLYAAVSVIRQLIQPKVIGENIGLHPLLTLVSMFVGFEVIGAWGLILGPIVVVVALALYRLGMLGTRSDGRQ